MQEYKYIQFMQLNYLYINCNIICTLSLKCKISAILLVETAFIFLIFLIATVQISMECETQECEVGHTKHLDL